MTFQSNKTSYEKLCIQDRFLLMTLEKLQHNFFRDSSFFKKLRYAFAIMTIYFTGKYFQQKDQTKTFTMTFAI